MPNLAEFPTVVKVGPFHYTIYRDVGRWGKIRYDADSATRVGQINYPELVIDIDPNLAPDMQASALMHELVHACLHCTLNGVRATEDLSDEVIASALDETLLELLRDNPDIVAYLVGG